VPALSTRRTETEVELQNGQTFAIAGLMNNTVTDSMRKIPGIGDVPILGWLFKSKAMQKNQTELVVMITPHIVRRGGIGVSESLPTAVEPYLPPPSKTHPQPEQWVGSPRHPANNASPSNTTYTPKPGGQPQRGGGDAQPQAMTVPPQGSTQTTPATTPMPGQAAAVQSEPQAEAAIETPKVDVAKEAAKLREEQQRAAEAQKAADKKAADENAVANKKFLADKAIADKKAAEAKAIADKKAALERERQQKLNAERAKREAEVAKKNQEDEAKRQAELKKHEKALADAAARLKEAQDAYKAAQGDKKKGVQ